MSRSRLPGLLTVVLAVVAVACTPSAAKPAWTFSPAAGGPTSAPSSGGAGGGATASPVAGGGGGGEVLGTLEVNAVDLGFEPKELSVSKAGAYEVHFTNNGAIPHDITFSPKAGTPVVLTSREPARERPAVPAAV